MLADKADSTALSRAYLMQHADLMLRPIHSSW